LFPDVVLDIWADFCFNVKHSRSFNHHKTVCGFQDYANRGDPMNFCGFDSIKKISAGFIECGAFGKVMIFASMNTLAPDCIS
jgi:hypothetical protein